MGRQPVFNALDQTPPELSKTWTEENAVLTKTRLLFGAMVKVDELVEEQWEIGKTHLKSIAVIFIFLTSYRCLESDTQDTGFIARFAINTGF